MTTDDEGMLFVLNDVEPEHEDEFNLWYDTEHMQERMAVPGFLSVSRYLAQSGALKYCTLYRTQSVAVFESDVYRQRLAAQTEWSNRMLKTFVEPNRLVGCIRKTLSHGAGGWLGVFRLSTRDERLAATIEGGMIAEIAALRGIVAVRLFEAAPRLSGPVKEYRPTLKPLFKPDDRIALVEASHASALRDSALGEIFEAADVETTFLGAYLFSWGMNATAS
jgi:hypothetical protein